MYTPGLTITPSTTISRTRELPILGHHKVEIGQKVSSKDAVLRAELPGEVEIVRVARQMGLEPVDLNEQVDFEIGSLVKKGQKLAEVKTFFGLFTSTLNSPTQGVVEFYNEVNCHLGLRLPPTPLEIDAYISGRIKSIDPGKSVEIETTGAFLQGIFGVGGEKQGQVLALDVPRDEAVSVGALRNFSEKLQGAVVIGGSYFEPEAIEFCSERRASGIITGSIDSKTLRNFVGHEIGVSITGDEDIPLTMIITEGFGELPIGSRFMDLARELDGKACSINGATQVRAGAMRPEVIVPDSGAGTGASNTQEELTLGVGRRVRIIRVPYFGELAQICELPEEPEVIESGAHVRVLRARLFNSEGELTEREVTVPRANVELV